MTGTVFKWERRRHVLWRRPAWLLAPLGLGLFAAWAVPELFRGDPSRSVLPLSAFMFFVPTLLAPSLAAPAYLGKQARWNADDLELTSIRPHQLMCGLFWVRVIPLWAAQLLVNAGVLW